MLTAKREGIGFVTARDRGNRNSYSKTDLEAAFMRIKEDHMLNSYVSNDRTDYNTLIPVIEKHRKAFGEILEEVTADSGYCSDKNLLYLKQKQIGSYIKLQDHGKWGTVQTTI